MLVRAITVVVRNHYWVLSGAGLSTGNDCSSNFDKCQTHFKSRTVCRIGRLYGKKYSTVSGSRSCREIIMKSYTTSAFKIMLLWFQTLEVVSMVYVNIDYMPYKMQNT